MAELVKRSPLKREWIYSLRVRVSLFVTCFNDSVPLKPPTAQPYQRS